MNSATQDVEDEDTACKYPSILGINSLMVWAGHDGSCADPRTKIRAISCGKIMVDTWYVDVSAFVCCCYSHAYHSHANNDNRSAYVIYITLLSTMVVVVVS